ncbi:hypothetical protein V6N13_127231 [Hibiscus sabdariffa]
MAPILRYLVLLHTIYVLNGGDRHWRLRSPATPRPTFRMVMLVVEYGAVELDDECKKQKINLCTDVAGEFTGG